MNVRPAEILITLLLACGFAFAGEAVLRRRSSDLTGWNESFLAGMGICAAALFPLSLIFPHGALGAELVVLGLATAVAAARRIRLRPEAGPAAAPGSRDPAALGLLGAIALVAAAFVALDFRYNLLWDGFQIWASKTQLLFYEGALGRTWYPGDTYELRHVPYPPLVPLYEALVDVLRGGFDFDSFKPVFVPFYLSMLVATYGASRSVVSARLALAATLLVALLPLLSTQHAAGGYADMPQAAFVAGAACAALRRTERSALPWLLGGLTTVKAEGTILAAVASAAVVALWLAEGGRRNLPDRAKAAAVTIAFFGLRFAHVRWAAAPDSVYAPLDGPHLAEALRRIPEVVHVCLVKMLSPRRWGLFWPAFFLSAFVLALRGSAREKALAAATATAAAVVAAAFLFTSWPLAIHIDQAYPRLLAQLAPAAAAAIVIGFHRAAGAESPADAAS